MATKTYPQPLFTLMALRCTPTHDEGVCPTHIHNFEGAQEIQINSSSIQSAGGNIVTYHNTFTTEHGQSNVEREQRY